MAYAKRSHRSWGFAGLVAGVGLCAPLAAAQPAGKGLPPLPAGSASAPAGSASAAAPAPTSSSASPGSAPPPYMVEEPYAPPEPDAPAPAPPPPGYAPPAYGAPYGAPPPVYYGPPPYPGYYPPPPYAYEPPPPPPPAHRAPRTAFWLGARGGVLLPFGKLYYDSATSYSGPNWSGAAGPGPSVEVDVGGRFGRRYMVYGFWEYARLGKGGDPAFHDAAGGQSGARTSLWGIGFRWTSFPDETGLAIDIGLGYRTFDLDWNDGSSLHMTSPFEVRLGIGADIRLSRAFTLSPMFQLTNGSFADGTYSPAGAPSYSIGGVEASHGTVGISVGGHFDVAGSQH